MASPHIDTLTLTPEGYEGRPLTYTVEVDADTTYSDVGISEQQAVTYSGTASAIANLIPEAAEQQEIRWDPLSDTVNVVSESTPAVAEIQTVALTGNDSNEVSTISGVAEIQTLTYDPDARSNVAIVESDAIEVQHLTFDADQHSNVSNLIGGAVEIQEQAYTGTGSNHVVVSASEVVRITCDSTFDAGEESAGFFTFLNTTGGTRNFTQGNSQMQIQSDGVPGSPWTIPNFVSTVGHSRGSWMAAVFNQINGQNIGLTDNDGTVTANAVFNVTTSGGSTTVTSDFFAPIGNVLFTARIGGGNASTTNFIFGGTQQARDQLFFGVVGVTQSAAAGVIPTYLLDPEANDPELAYAGLSTNGGVQTEFTANSNAVQALTQMGTALAALNINIIAGTVMEPVGADPFIDIDLGVLLNLDPSLVYTSGSALAAPFTLSASSTGDPGTNDGLHSEYTVTIPGSGTSMVLTSSVLTDGASDIESLISRITTFVEDNSTFGLTRSGADESPLIYTDTVEATVPGVFGITSVHPMVPTGMGDLDFGITLRTQLGETAYRTEVESDYVVRQGDVVIGTVTSSTTLAGQSDLFGTDSLNSKIIALINDSDDITMTATTVDSNIVLTGAAIGGQDEVTVETINGVVHDDENEGTVEYIPSTITQGGDSSLNTGTPSIYTVRQGNLVLGTFMGSIRSADALPDAAVIASRIKALIDSTEHEDVDFTAVINATTIVSTNEFEGPADNFTVQARHTAAIGVLNDLGALQFDFSQTREGVNPTAGEVPSTYHWNFNGIEVDVHAGDPVEGGENDRVRVAQVVSDRFNDLALTSLAFTGWVSTIGADEVSIILTNSVSGNVDGLWTIVGNHSDGSGNIQSTGFETLIGTDRTFVGNPSMFTVTLNGVDVETFEEEADPSDGAVSQSQALSRVSDEAIRIISGELADSFNVTRDGTRLLITDTVNQPYADGQWSITATHPTNDDGQAVGTISFTGLQLVDGADGTQYDATPTTYTITFDGMSSSFESAVPDATGSDIEFVKTEVARIAAEISYLTESTDNLPTSRLLLTDGRGEFASDQDLLTIAISNPGDITLTDSTVIVLASPLQAQTFRFTDGSGATSDIALTPSEDPVESVGIALQLSEVDLPLWTPTVEGSVLTLTATTNSRDDVSLTVTDVTVEAPDNEVEAADITVERTQGGLGIFRAPLLTLTP